MALVEAFGMLIAKCWYVVLICKACGFFARRATIRKQLEYLQLTNH